MHAIRQLERGQTDKTGCCNEYLHDSTGGFSPCATAHHTHISWLDNQYSNMSPAQALNPTGVSGPDKSKLHSSGCISRVLHPHLFENPP